MRSGRLGAEVKTCIVVLISEILGVDVFLEGVASIGLALVERRLLYHTVRWMARAGGRGLEDLPAQRDPP